MSGINFTVVTRVEPLTVACLLEADSGATAGIFAASSVVLIYLRLANACERSGANFTVFHVRLSDGVEGVCSDSPLAKFIRAHFSCVLALRTGPPFVVAVGQVLASTELVNCAINVHLRQMTAIFAVKSVHIS